MAHATPLNGQITDATTQLKGVTISEAPAAALSTLAQLTAQATSLNLENALTAEQAETILAQAAATSGGAAMATGEIHQAAAQSIGIMVEMDTDKAITAALHRKA